MRQGGGDQREHVAPPRETEPRHGGRHAAQTLAQIDRVGAQDIDGLAQALGEGAQGRGPIFALALRARRCPP